MGVSGCQGWVGGLRVQESGPQAVQAAAPALRWSVGQPVAPTPRSAWPVPTNPAVACCCTRQDRKKEYLKQKKLKKKGKGGDPLLTEREAALAARTAATAPRLGEVGGEGGWC